MAECRYYEMCARRAGSRDLPRSCDARHCWMFRPMPDVDALLALADEMDKWALTCDHYDRQVSPLEVTKYARRIREACGEVVA